MRWRIMCPREWSLVAAVLMLAQTGLAQEKQPPRPPLPLTPPAPKAYAQEYQQSFRALPGLPPRWEYEGPDAADCIRFEPDGMRLTLPAGYAGVRGPTGLFLNTAVKGDFEVTLDFEILKEPTKADVGPTGTRLGLGAYKINTPKVTVATHSRSFGAKQGSVFYTWLSLANPQKDKPDVRGNHFPTKANTGRLRMVRSGPDLWYASQDGPDAEFRWLTKYRFGDEDLRRFQIAGSTGSETAYLDARVMTLRVRADALPELAGQQPAPIDAPPPAAPTTTGSKGWLALTVVGGLGAILLLAAGIVTWLMLRSRPVDAVAFPCEHCGETLTAKPDAVGKKLKCSHCGKVVFVGE